MTKPSFEDLLERLNDADLVKFALRRRGQLPAEQNTVLEDVVKRRISPERWKKLQEQLVRDGLGSAPEGVDPGFLRNQPGGKKSKRKFPEWMVWVTMVSLVVLVSAVLYTLLK
jgi:hypothetical protein